MSKVPLFLLLALQIACLRFPASPVQVAESSLIKITGLDDGHPVSCSGFVIAPNRVLTAGHCVTDVTDIRYDGIKKSHIILKDAYYDLALVEVKTLKPALRLEDEPVYENESLTAIGYARGWNHLVALDEKVKMVNYPVETDTASGIIMQGGLIGGMSGGPIINVSGRVVSVCQRANNFMGYGVSVPMIKAFLQDSKGHREDTLGIDLDMVEKSYRSVDLAVTPRFGLRVPMTVRTTIHTDPDEKARGLCLQWDSDTGEAGLHCFTHEGSGAPKTTQWDLLIHSPGEYAIQAILVRVSDAVRSVVQRVIIQAP